MDVFADGTLYFEKHGHRFAPPTTPMRFQQANQNLQVVLSSYTINNLLETVVQTGWLSIPFAGKLSTSLMLPVIPELYYNFGGRDVTLQITPVSGTTVDFSANKTTATVNANALVDWLVFENATTTTNAFTSLLDLSLELTYSINGTKWTVIEVEQLAIKGFNVTKDNLGGSV